MKSHAATALRWLDFPLATWRWLRRGDACLQDFRASFATSLGVDTTRVHLFGSGRAALHAYVASLDLPTDAEVLLPGYTCAVVPNVFEHLGLPVRYVDIEAGGFNPSAAGVASAIGPATRLVLVPHNFGISMAGVASLRERFPHIVFIEDAAHAWGSRDAGGHMVGTLGHAAFFSFEYSKPLSTGLGGALLVNDSASGWQPPALHRPAALVVAKQALTLAWHRLVQALPVSWLNGLKQLLRAPSRRLGVVAATPAGELQGSARPDYRLSLHPWSAALGERQAARAAEIWAARRTQADSYDALLPATLRAERGAGDVLLRYPLRLPAGLDHETLAVAMATEDIELGRWFDDVVHPRGSLRYGYRSGDCPVGEATADCVANLPLGLHAGLSQRQRQALRARLTA
ncbi:DegT/DnrJ/EryC1/StrS family aminotransferase [Roseateles asaccharophilus]|uniref:dTDP-4-amino-4,6-dideoxygalactose transaminase n=1 Tax=Roseateles asaccharophilus TaxID=582607 RepID=A0ABU2ABV4_9BURK|nr:DegT/DnrJ/EryC1/StrS family aminotransferase [Roseateles asaccharophilus]MDR7334687.1 dTDP-4-amino-4,6-dideoxygalactose transaminase [Roseateles asaccharophilus]